MGPDFLGRSQDGSGEEMTILVHLSINKPYGNQVTCGATCTQSIFVTCLQTHVQIPGVSSPSTAGWLLGQT